MIDADRARYLALDNSRPERLCVRDVTPPGNATRLFALVADYGWAERILFSDAYVHDANDIASILGRSLDIPVTLVPLP